MAGDIGELLAEAGLGRDAGALLLQPVAKGLDQRGAARLALGEPPLRRAASDLGLDGVEFGDPAQALGGDLRAAAVVDFAEPGRNICPTGDLGDRSRRSPGCVEAVVAGETVGLQDAGEAAQMLDRMIARAVPRVAEQGRRRVRTAERPVVADIDPGPPGRGLAPGQYRHGGVVAVQAFGCQHMGRNQVVQGLQSYGAGAHLVGQGRQAEIDAVNRLSILTPLIGTSEVVPVANRGDPRGFV